MIDQPSHSPHRHQPKPGTETIPKPGFPDRGESQNDDSDDSTPPIEAPPTKRPPQPWNPQPGAENNVISSDETTPMSPGQGA
jgi:hypothetical protein